MRTNQLASVLLIAKQPVPGKVKTRLTPPFSAQEAAQLAGAALDDTLRAASAVPARQHILVLAGSPAGLRRPGWNVLPQSEGGLDVRLAAAFTAVAASGPAVLVGMDTPQLRAPQLAAFDPTAFDCCLGPAADGGFWALGFAEPHLAEQAITGVPMSQPDTGQRQLDRLHDAGLRVQLLDELTDVDDAATADEVARQAPHTSFAACYQRLSVRAGAVLL